jgi:hypothetical protein
MPLMKRFRSFILLSSLLTLCMPLSVRAEPTPDQAVKKYLEAMQAQKFGDAYDYVSSALRGGKDREEWSKEQQYIVQMGEVKIFGFKVFPAVVEGETAKVPNILKSQDKFLNQLGLDEYELYELVREEGTWRINQQTLVEGAEREEYFPAE